MEKITKLKIAFRSALADPVTRKRLSLTTLACAVLLGASIANSEVGNDRYLVDESGEVTALYREDPEVLTEFVISLDIDGDGDGPREYRVVPNRADDATEGATDTEDRSELIRDAEIGSIIAEIENSHSREISLPKTLSDGTKLTWTKDHQTEYG